MADEILENVTALLLSLTTTTLLPLFTLISLISTVASHPCPVNKPQTPPPSSISPSPANSTVDTNSRLITRGRKNHHETTTKTLTMGKLHHTSVATTGFYKQIQNLEVRVFSGKY